MTQRKVMRIIQGVATSDGAGVKLTRSIGVRPDDRVDPFLLLDEFFSDDAADYIGGFPSHPHRGFQTVTYMLDGHMLHEDHMGNRGDLEPGDVQWMNAGRGVIHSEMPQQTEGRMRGFQLWINLHAEEKLSPASYRDIKSADIPVVDLPRGGSAKVVAGDLSVGDQLCSGPITELSTDPLYVDVSLPATGMFEQRIKDDRAVVVYVYEGDIGIDEGDSSRDVRRTQAAVLSPSGDLSVKATTDARFLLLAGKPINEPVVQYGPFVMNTSEQIEQAIQDYANGVLTTH